MAPFLHTLSRPYDVYLMRAYWPWPGLDESQSGARKDSFFLYFSIKPTWHHNFFPSCLCCLCSSPFQHIYLHDESSWAIQAIQSLTLESSHRQTKFNPFVVVPYSTTLSMEWATLSPLSAPCATTADGTGQQNRPGHWSHSDHQMIVDCTQQFVPPIWLYPLALMEKYGWQLPCANLGLNVQFVPVKADPLFNSCLCNAAFIYQWE